MRIDNYSKEMMDENSFIDMSYIYLQDKGEDTDLYDIIDKFKEVGGYSDEEIENRILQFYTDLNTDGRFLSTGENVWGLRDWYSVDDISDKVAPTIHKIELATEEDEVVFEEEQDDTPADAFDQDKDLVDSDTEDLHSPLNDRADEELDETLDEPLGETLEYDDTDDLEDNYEDDEKSV
ncbi:DNA-directed RNA polymerase subunit delta [Salinicoccus halitifaciens]|uniref:Probable DNA-directed RNA polymerase subunit delta n=1 Tax=Salinicoccus halitifaciens TaxID=1073415 RepID=A0ABV2E9L0_9STAP|nr:DNA-directed RNA polymerase subunit delta [Salinicoccus halitifaciens]MCD2138139.1 DNA-directed RNA polymerase subunit delta [Salinicoccus halitifaciens]